MEKIVFTIREDMCDQNVKTPTMVAALKETMSKYGTLVPYDTDVAKLKQEYQDNIDALTKQLDAIRANDLNENEINLVNCFRVLCTKIHAESEKTEQQLRDALDKANKKLAETRSLIQSVIDKDETEE